MRTRAWFFAGCLSVVLLAGCSDDDKKTSSRTGAQKDEDSGTSPIKKDEDSGTSPIKKDQDSGTSSPTTTKIDRSALSDVGIESTPLDYSDRRLWLCQPGNDPDECDRDLDATELAPDGSRKVVKHVKASDPKFDCFYVYPTVKLDANAVMTDFSNIDSTLDPLLGQGAPFNSLCRMYAPLYRQQGFIPGGDPTAPKQDADPMLGVNDVRAAFKYYLEHFNQGRKFVLIGHSQGTAMLIQVTSQDVDNVPDVRAKLISALLIGGNFTVASGKTTGGTLQNIPICDKPGQVGCVIAYSSYAKEAPPTDTALFGKSSNGMDVACTEPAALAANSGKYAGSYFPTSSVNPTFSGDGADLLPKDLTTPYVLYRDVFQGSCQNKNGFNYLEVALDWPAGDTQAKPPYRNSGAESIGFGMHIVDYSFALDDLIAAVKLQADAALKAK